MLAWALGIPLIGGLIGLVYAGTPDKTVYASTTPPAGGTKASISMPWYVVPLIVIGGILLVIIVVKGVLKKQNII